jgi:hypothetical protein
VGREVIFPGLGELADPKRFDHLPIFTGRGWKVQGGKY